MSNSASNFINSVDLAFYLSLGISVFFLLLITVLIITFVIKFNSKKNPKPQNIHSNTLLEVTWTVIPTILVMILFWFGWIGYEKMEDIPKDAIKVDVTARMWQWSFTYENGKQTDTLVVPLNKAVVLNLHSLDVNHAFFVPAFRLKKDVYPGLERKAWFVAEDLGSYTITCAEYCGLNHSNMYSKIVVVPEDKYDLWISKNQDEKK